MANHSLSDNEYLPPRWAVFNGHVNSAAKRAREAFIKRWGRGLWDEKIQPFVDKGVMSVFEEKPNEHTTWYVEVLTVLVNETRGGSKGARE